PFRKSRWRWPTTGRSSVTTSALHFAAAARSKTDRRQSQRQRRGCAQDRRARAAVSHIDQDALAQLDALEVGAIGGKSLLGVRAALNEVEERPGHLAAESVSGGEATYRKSSMHVIRSMDRPTAARACV